MEKMTPKKAAKQSRLQSVLARILTPTPMKIGLAIVLACILALFRHYQLPKGAEAPLDWVGVLERALFDMRFKIRGERPVSKEIGILAADEKSVSQFGRWPFPRSIYKQALENLKKADVEWIGFDAVFSEDERPYLDESVEAIQNAIELSSGKGGFDFDTFNDEMNTLFQASTGDVQFGQAISEFVNIVQGFFFLGDKISNDPKARSIADYNYDWISQAIKIQSSSLDFVSFPPQKSLKDYPELISPGALANTETIAGESAFQGFFSNNPDPDGIIRRATLVQGLIPLDENLEPVGEPILTPSLSLKLAAEYLGRVPLVEFDDAGVNSIQLMDPNGEANPIRIPVTLDGSGRILINHYGDEFSFPQISLADAYNNEFPKGEKLPKILLFGATAVGMNDQRPSPFSETIDGVNHHAAVLENILSENFIKRPLEAFPIELGLLLGTGILFSLLLKITSAVVSATALAVFMIGFFYIDKIYLFGNGHWFYIGMIYIQKISIYVGVTFFKYFTEEREKKKIKNAFAHYLNPAVISDLMEHPEQLQLGGQKKDLTVFFSDVRGFTTISETLSPEALTALLNEYFTPMTGHILDSGGLLDKYIGDAIMAVWGAPIPLADHADRALASSLKMLDSLAILQEKWRAEAMPPIDIGIGLNTGPMVVGNMGSDQRFDYTVLGDAVNLGARLEGINKQYGTRILLSEFTRANLKNPGQFLLREIDMLKVKGKNEPVTIYEGVHLGNRNPQHLLEIVGHFERGLAEYRKRNWDKAIEYFNTCLRIIPDDQPSSIFIERCQLMKREDPGDAWDGVWVMKTK
jgi:adenylate cyclase